jgi:Protein of unknown function (DUF2281)
MKQMILEQIQRLPPSAQQEALCYIEALVAKYISINPVKSADSIETPHPLSKFYGCIDDETFIRQPQGKLNDRESF